MRCDEANTHWTLSRRSRAACAVTRVSLLIAVLLVLAYTSLAHAMPERRRLELKNKTKEMFFHGWNNYLEYGYPADELNPILCNGRGSDKSDPTNININDILGDYSLTLVDNLDTLAIIGSQHDFEDAVQRVLQQVSFDQDNKVQVFELNIRALGGLLSAHILASDPRSGHTIPHYDGGLLKLAVDLADRLVPAFHATATGLPYPRVNLRRGVPPTETVETCTAGAGSLVLEFGVLSRLTGNPLYENLAKRALKALWDRRSDIDLLGNVINIQTGQWVHTASSTGAGIDSFFEYLLKAHVLFGDPEYLVMFEDAYDGIMKHVRDPSGYLYRNVHMSSGALMATWIDSLSAFWPGLQVMYGDLNEAAKGHLVFYYIWRRFHSLPERFDFYRKSVDIGFYPLRPEFIESTYYLYQATRDPFYLHVGETILEDIDNRTRLPCGFASIGDVRTGRLEDRMESFLLSETLKYLYLLFDTENPLNKDESNFVFTTEGHLFALTGDKLTPGHSAGRGTCARPRQGTHYLVYPHALDTSSIEYQPQADFAAALVGYQGPTPPLHDKGYCVPPYWKERTFDLSFAHRGKQWQTPKVIELVGGILTKTLGGLKLELARRPERSGGGYQVIQVHPSMKQRLSEHQQLMIPLSVIEPYIAESDMLQIRLADGVQVRVQGATASRQFLGVLSENSPSVHVAGLVTMPFDNIYGCRPYLPHALKDRIVVVWRGECTFDEKVAAAHASGAKAIVFINSERQEERSEFRALVRPGSPLMSVSITPYDGILDVEGEWHVLEAMPEPGPPVLHLQGAPIHNIALLHDTP